ncbi:MAG TPA: HlyD family efflux transporter periplasmic adaptor subunit [Ramlibacter sp.]|uniref:HlyD family secretion protein n=1 Tax=Ramlibacter sp. TaxID=1917967 RepID=UPI002D7F89AD|nr:HlyD family efflux transporter periplasmic adaptor subunit [Ramlibacter sp.]HET8745239.1 HlyD family efflux transporter periplasmic adaptor subunit [Ramlibacter sp.]
MPTRFVRTTRSLAHDGGRRTLLGFGIAGVLLAAWLTWFLFGRVTVYEVSRQARIEVQQSAHPIASLVQSRIASNPLVLGQEVRAGDLLIELDARPEQLRLQEEQARLQTLLPRIASLKKEVAALEKASASEQEAARAATQGASSRIVEAAAAVDFARENEKRLREESAVGGVAQIEAVRAQAETLKLAAARDALAAEQRRLATEAEARAYQQQAQIESLRRTILSMQGEAQAAESTIARLSEEIERHQVRAPIGGTIADVAVLRTGAYVAAGQKLATVVPHGGLIIVGEFVPAAVLGRIRPGQAARLRLDGFPWAQYGMIDARVVRVAGEVRDGLVRVEFQPARQVEPKLPLQHGLPGSIEVGIEEISPAQLVLRAVGHFDAPTPAPAALPVIVREMAAQ